jgi:hypothetical protein
MREKTRIYLNHGHELFLRSGVDKHGEDATRQITFLFVQGRHRRTFLEVYRQKTLQDTRLSDTTSSGQGPLRHTGTIPSTVETADHKRIIR